MTQEIVYTSAPQGLKPGSKGFCTVVSTNGMSGNLSERLEMLSGYRHAFAPGDRNAPVNYAHLHIKVSGQTYFVLSRICDAGLDYSQRSNKLAHHVALTDSELVAAGPAAVLAAPGFCETQWNGAVQTLDSGRVPTASQARPAVCRIWQQLTGDAGWAGVLAHSATVSRPKPVSVIYPPGVSVLPLVVEAMNLIPPSKRWDVTFSTYFTKAIAGSDCLWRFVLDGTSQASALRKNPNALVIDLGSRLAAPPDSSYLNSARTGMPSADYSDHFVVSVGPGNNSSRPPALLKAYKAPQAETAEEPYDNAAEDYGAYDAFQSMPAVPPLPPRALPWYKKTITIVLGGVLLLAGIAGAVLTAYQMGRNSEIPVLNPVLQEPIESSESQEAVESDLVPDGSEDQEDREPVVPVINPVVAVRDLSQEVTPLDSPEVTENPFADYAAEERNGVIPFYLQEADDICRRPLVMANPSRCELEIHAADPGIDSVLSLVPVATDSSDVSTPGIWIASLGARGGGKDTVLGTFRLDGRDLIFERSVDREDPRFNRFLYSILTVSTNGYTMALALVAPEQVVAEQIRLVKSTEDIRSRIPLPPVIEGTVQDALRFDIVHPEFEGFVIRSLKSGDSFVVGFQMDGQVRVERRTGTHRPNSGFVAAMSCALEVATVVDENDSDAAPLSRCILTVIPSVYLRLLKTTDPISLGKEFLRGKPDLLLDAKRFDWDMEIVSRHLSLEQGEKKIRSAVRREFNGQVSDGPQLDQDADSFWTAVVDNVDRYYESPPAVRQSERQRFKTGVETLVGAVRNYGSTLAAISSATERFHANELQIRGYVIVNGHALEVVQTRAPDERN